MTTQHLNDLTIDLTHMAAISVTLGGSGNRMACSQGSRPRVWVDRDLSLSLADDACRAAKLFLRNHPTLHEYTVTVGLYSAGSYVFGAQRQEVK